MELLLARLAGSRPPAAETLRAALHRQDWLEPEPGRRGPWARFFSFGGGRLHAAGRPSEASPYATPLLRVSLLPDADFASVAPRLVSLAGTLRLGIDTEGSNGALWWPAPDPASLDLQAFDRAVAASRACDPREGWPFLGFALAGPECLELAESHPALACLLASAPRVGGRYRADIAAERRAGFLREVARRPRREILAALDFPATESMVRLLGKVHAGRLNLESLRLLRDLRLAPHAAKALRHLPRFGSGLVPIAVRRRLWPHVGPQLLREAAEERDEGDTFFRLRDTVDMAEALGRVGDVGVVPSRAALEVLHDRLRQEYEARPQRNLREIARREAAAAAEPARIAPPPPPRPPVPPPPLVREPPPPPPGLVLLGTPADLRKEGREMSSCVGSYWRKVERGDYVVYRVLEPERATLGLRWSKARALWSIDQVKGFANGAVSTDTRLYLRDWLETGVVRPEAARWARDHAQQRHRELLRLLAGTTDPDDRAQLLAELARLRVGEPPGLASELGLGWHSPRSDRSSR